MAVAFGFRATCAADGGVSGAQCAATSRGACHGRRPNHGAGRPAWHANGSVAACGKLSLAGVVLVGPELTQGPRHVTGRRGASCLAVARLHTATETLSVRIRACSSGGRTAAATYLVATVPTASLAAGPTDPRIAPISSAADAPVVDASVSPRLAPAGPAPRGARPHRHGPGRPGAVLHPVPGRQRRRPGRAADRAGGDHHPGPALCDACRAAADLAGGVLGAAHCARPRCTRPTPPPACACGARPVGGTRPSGRTLGAAAGTAASQYIERLDREDTSGKSSLIDAHSAPATGCSESVFGSFRGLLAEALRSGTVCWPRRTPKRRGAA